MHGLRRSRIAGPFVVLTVMALAVAFVLPAATDEMGGDNTVDMAEVEQGTSTEDTEPRW